MVIIPIPTGRRYTATITGEKLKSVECVHCNTRFLYVMKGRASGQGSSPLYLDNDGAKRRATEKAQRALHELLEKGCQPVSCPGCGKYQDNMAKVLRSKKYNWLIVAGILLALASGITWLVSFANYPQVPFAANAATGLLGGFAALCIFYRIRAQFSFDANAGAEERVAKQAFRAEGGIPLEEFQEAMRQARDRELASSSSS